MNRLTVLLAALCMSVMSLVAQQTAQIRQLMDSIFVVEPTEDNYYDAACLYALMGRSEQALNAFDKALSLGYRDFQHIAVDTDLDAIRELPRFTEILNKYRKLEVQSKFDLLKGADTDMK